MLDHEERFLFREEILNLANALGAWIGGVVLSRGLGYEWPSRVGGFLALTGLAIALLALVALRETLAGQDVGGWRRQAAVALVALACAGFAIGHLMGGAADWFLALALAGGLYWQLTASVTQIARSVGDPSTRAEYFQPAAAWLRAHGGEEARIEVPPTANHWESAYLAPSFELARGWLRQIDTTRDDIFYRDGKLTLAEAEALPAHGEAVAARFAE